jgi:lambda family phage tail tape measure protein
MASKIITQWITMTILNSVLKLFPGGAGAAGAAGGGLAGSSLPGGFANPLVGAYTNANGNAFAANGIVPYAKGGIVNSPTLFKFAKGGAMQTGIMGEAGAEAVMPLKRGPDGKLGVAATGGGGVNVVVNVDAKGSAVQGDQGQGNELGRVIAGAVQAELIKQQRPGGLLTR